MGAAAVLPVPAALFPWSTPDAALDVVLAVCFFGSIAAIAWASFHSRPDGAAEGPAIRAHKLMPNVAFDCVRKDVADGLVAQCGGYVAPQRALRATIALVVVPLVLACLGGGFGIAQWLFLSSLVIDHAGHDVAIVTVDRREVARVKPGDHEKVYVRHGRRDIAWTFGARHGERTLDVVRGRDLLLNPGPTQCYWKEVGVYKREHDTMSVSEAEDSRRAGPLALSELHVLPSITNWFEELPQQKSDRALESNVDVAILRNETCSRLLARECAPGTVEDFLVCQRKAKTQADVSTCVENALAFCSPE
jgi:hypothetical protein